MIEEPAARVAVTKTSPSWVLWVGAGLLTLILASTVIWTMVGGEAPGPRPATARVGSPAPEVELAQLVKGSSGPITNLTSLTGRPVVLNFWATWCVPCRAEFPAIEAKFQEYKDSHQLVIVGINAQSDAGPAAAQQFVNQMGATFPIWLDVAGKAEVAYRVQALPTTIFIDRRSGIQDLIVGGPMTEETLEKELKKIF
jgi:thiol-disulfide isomerase/thioredoxin